MISERLLQFIWQFQYFDKADLFSSDGELVKVQYAGHYNTNQGPDFLNAKIVIGKTTWAGAVELHILSSDWKKHKHQTDKNYQNVILHVVWEKDDSNGNIPVLELKGRVSGILLRRYETLMTRSAFIPCENLVSSVKTITWNSWKERLLAERLMRKAKTADQFLKENKNHWEETFWWMLARNFGMKVNTDAFEAVARSIPVNILAKHKNQLQQIEALLMGQASLLNEKSNKELSKDGYYTLLQREYKFLKEKYGLKPVYEPVHFLRMRPGNFPTIRLAQLAVLIQNSVHLFSRIREAESIKEVKNRFDATANDYWHYHYKFGEAGSFKKKKLGESMIENIIINTICPMLFAYGNYHNEQKHKDKALKWLEHTNAELNNITKGFSKLGIENKNAFDSQALIELKNEYCNKKSCLECGVGNAILKSTK
ncbi:MAG TPA: DUF2851 family protein [Chitinophagaceae bacterium]|nr:DUF2851 family protein [Chitinophagaceae bacterium]